MDDKKFTFILSNREKKSYKISEYNGTFYAYYFYDYSLLGGSKFRDLGKARSYDDAMMICRTHALQFGRIENTDFRGW